MNQKKPPDQTTEEFMNTGKKGSGSGNTIGIFFCIITFFLLLEIVAPRAVRVNASIRAKVSRAKADLRTIATALETYYVDKNEYPAMIEGNAIPLQTLTSPHAYLSDHSYEKDPFGKENKQSYGYLHDKKQKLYILVSNGPDLDRDITLSRIQKNADIEKKEDLEAFLESLTYDPTNGITSDGDIVRMQRIIP